MIPFSTLIKNVGYALLVSSLLISCSGTASNQSSTIAETGKPSVSTEANINPPAEVIPAAATGNRANDSVAQSYPNPDGSYPALLLNATTYHAEEFQKEWSSRTWMGLFKKGDTYYLQQTPIRAIRVEDAIVDDNGQKTGWQVSTAIKDSNVVLFAGLNGIKEGPVEDIKIPKEALQPGTDRSFYFKGNTYSLQVKADAKKARSGETIYYNYQLTISYTSNGKEVQQLLVSHAQVDEVMPYLLFIGDINSDGLPDLLLDTTGHYNVVTPTLYLSDKTKTEGFLQVVALHTSVGC